MKSYQKNRLVRAIGAFLNNCLKKEDSEREWCSSQLEIDMVDKHFNIYCYTFKIKGGEKNCAKKMTNMYFFKKNNY